MDINELIQRREQETQENITQAKAALFAYLAEHYPQIVRIMVVYSGYGDEGYISDGGIEYYDEDNNIIEPEPDAKLNDLIEDIHSHATPDGYEVNEGGDGEIEIKVAEQQIIINHNQNQLSQRSETYEY